MFKIRIIDDGVYNYFMTEKVDVFNYSDTRKVTMLDEGLEGDDTSQEMEMKIDLCSVHIYLKEDKEKECYIYEVHKNIDPLKISVEVQNCTTVVDDLLIDGISVLSVQEKS
ncbi:hypothetical protein PM10SUCC1_28240 [Propionigenium maris DSM 9537]|uniref:Uncharacterized protein n=1 Tax=Propionigenium maris DSM 9537 TaxID=1123000 RepID=A0A9W6GNE4_9FUSO|nr:hypothetical protein [Propionigenium maris]GLI57310.1 hypothetical protein PM10SUCC1_28240 [Propionigenium maris DSM 9537]